MRVYPQSLIQCWPLVKTEPSLTCWYWRRLVARVCDRSILGILSLEWHHTLVWAEVPNCCIRHCQMVLRLRYWIAQVTFNSETWTQSLPAVQMLRVITLKRSSHEIKLKKITAFQDAIVRSLADIYIISSKHMTWSFHGDSIQWSLLQRSVVSMWSWCPTLQRLSLSPLPGLMCADQHWWWRQTLSLKYQILTAHLHGWLPGKTYFSSKTLGNIYQTTQHHSSTDSNPVTTATASNLISSKTELSVR
jgi:hypothetical protein